jgi:eukaryotic-like serine/threonine-protein kinase
VSFEPIQFGKYKLIQPLAQGGMAEIFLAKQQGPAGYEKSVVIKRVLSHYSAHPEFVAMFLDEARLAAQLSHPNIVQIFDFGQNEGSYYLCMEYLRGEDLHTLVKLAAKKNLPISAQVAATVVAAACDALHYAHALTSDDGQPLNIVHRDISPSNIFVSFQGVVKVLDFGIARAEGKVVKTATGMIKGKLAYMAPEQAKGQALDGRADVWALGAVLHELLTGKRLFWRGNDVESFRALLDERVPLPSELRAGIPRELDEICGRALERNLDRRYTSAKEMYADLDDFLSSRTYVPSQTLLQTYLQELVGREEVAAKLKSSLSKAVPVVAAVEPAPARSAVTKGSGAVRSLPVPSPAPADETRGAPPSAPVRRRALTHDAIAPLAPPPTAPTPVKKSPVGILVAVVAALGVFAGLVYFAMGDPPERPRSRPLVVETVHDDPEPLSEPDEPPPVAIPAAKPPEPKPTKGLLDVNCVPWCQIYLDGKDTGRTSPAIGISVGAGKHRLRVVNTPTGVEQEKDVVIRAGATTREVVKF